MLLLVTEETVSTRVCEFRRDPDGFIYATMKTGARFELADAKECVEATRNLAGARTSVLVDMRGVQSQSKEARAYFNAPEIAKDLSAVALLVSSPVSRVIANFFLGVRTQPVPTRMFDDEASARAWLRAGGA